MYEELVQHFKEQVRLAEEEVARLQALAYDVNWYAFEVACREWNHPWPQSKPDSRVCLTGCRSGVTKTGAEWVVFPVYYEGEIQHAPPLPPQIVVEELRDADERLRIAREELTAPDDWAPGGYKYEALRATTLVGRKLSSGGSGG